MILLELLVHAPWPTWLAAAMLLLVAGLLALVIERSRRETYRTVLSAAPSGSSLLDVTRRGRVLLFVRALDRRPYEGALARAESDTSGP
jgi:hypothetical protein